DAFQDAFQNTFRDTFQDAFRNMSIYAVWSYWPMPCGSDRPEIPQGEHSISTVCFFCYNEIKQYMRLQRPLGPL
ncbi:MAG TPA: hypothetical protein DCR16_04575, partial [Lachnospiraceae bacterium]|nr:hypothetical protein [Lachnospiraceae bacterium]